RARRHIPGYHRSEGRTPGHMMKHEKPAPPSYVRDDASGLWMREGTPVSWGYSDGDQVEQALLRAVEACQDRSVLSPELARQVHDWPTLYYFSPRRANLLRPFASLLRGRVLEVGAGCGAVSRTSAKRPRNCWRWSPRRSGRASRRPVAATCPT